MRLPWGTLPECSPWAAGGWKRGGKGYRASEEEEPDSMHRWL